MKKIIFFLTIFITFLNAENIYATFDVVAQKSANLAFTASGIVKNIYVDIGSIVKKDTILADLENSDIKAMLDKTKIILKYAQKELKRKKKLKILLMQINLIK